MRALIVYCNPNPESYSAHLRDEVIAALDGHEVKVIDLYGEGFDPVMSREERAGYHTPEANEVPVSAHIERLKWADTVIFVYPTWWFNVPAMLKGWLDRVMVPYATFILPDEDQPMRPQLTNIRTVVAITTCGARFLVSKIAGEPGRKTLLRGFRFICHPRCRTRYAALYGIDTSSDLDRTNYAAHVRRLVSRL